MYRVSYRDLSMLNISVSIKVFFYLIDLNVKGKHISLQTKFIFSSIRYI